MRRLLSLLLVGLFLINFSSAILTDNVTRVYHLDESSGTVFDYSNNHINATANSTTTRSIVGKFNTAYNFTNSNASVMMGAKISGTSLVFWVFPQNYSASKTLFFNPADNHAIYQDVGGFITLFRNPTTLNTSIKPLLNQWNMVVIRHNGTGYFTSVNNGTENYSIVGEVLLNEFGGRSNSGVQNYNGAMDEIIIFNRTITQAEINTLWNSGNGYPHTLNSPTNNSINLVNSNIIFNWNSLTVSENLINTSLYIDNLKNETISISGTNNTTTTNKIFTTTGAYNWTIESCTLNSCINSSTNYFNITKLVLNSISYSPSVLSGEAITITANISLSSEPTSLYLNYNNQNYTPSVTSGTNDYILTNSLNAPSVGANTNVSIYYLADIGGTIYSTQVSNQSVQVVNVTTNCSIGNFRFINITNFDEQTLASINGTVEYTLQVLSNNGLTVNLLNGSATANNISLCSNINLTNANSTYSLQLRYYGQAITNVSFGNYSYETYNIQSMNMSNIPYTIPLYFLDNVTGVKFRLAYKDFYYLTHPNALIQIQRKYLGENLYRIVELPVIGSGGYAYASFNQNNVRYKIIVIENGVTIDTFNDQFPVCQNVVLGTCDLELRGVEGSSTATTSDFSYTLTSTNNSLSLTFTIPSGTPRTIFFATNQSSRFIKGLATCNNSVYGSGGTLTCSYNNTIGDSIVQIQIDGTGEGTLYGSYNVPEDLSSFFLLNNYVIAFILLLSLVIMFIASEKMMMIMSGVGIIYLGVIFLIKGVGLTTIATSIIWLLIAIIIAIYDISKKEDKT